MQQPTSANTRNLIAACAAITVFGLAFGMTYPLLSLILESRGVSTDMIGINSAMMPIGILLFSSVIPVASKRFGSRNVAIAAAIATSFLIIAYQSVRHTGSLVSHSPTARYGDLNFVCTQ